MSAERKDAAPRPEALPAGWEMDVLISARIFGAPYAGACRTDGPVVLLPSGGLPTCPHYSTDIAAAWQVVEKLRPWYWTKIGVGMRIDTSERLHEVAMGLYATPDESSRQLAYERGADLPLAICRAALAARPTETPEGRP